MSEREIGYYWIRRKGQPKGSFEPALSWFGGGQVIAFAGFLDDDEVEEIGEPIVHGNVWHIPPTPWNGPRGKTPEPVT